MILEQTFKFPYVSTPPVRERYRIAWDDENVDYDYKSRTQQPDWGDLASPPAVYRFYPEPREQSGDYRVNMEAPYNWRQAILDLNGGDLQKLEFLTDPHRATYNNTGWPQQAYISMSGNELQGEMIGEWFRFTTLRPGDLPLVSGMAIDTHPRFVHRFTCVTWRNNQTVHIESTNTARGQVYFFLITREGFAYIPKRHVVRF